MRKVTVRKRRRIFDDFFKIDEAQVRFERFDGRMSPPVRRLVFERGDSVAAIVYFRKDKRILLAEQFRFPTWKKGPGWVVEAVAGMIDKAERPSTAMRRELVEEIGFRPLRLDHIATFYVSPGGSSERIWLYYAEVDGHSRIGSGGGLAAENEDIRLVTWSLKEANEAIERRRVVDAKTLIGLQWLLAREAKGRRRSGVHKRSKES